MHTTGLAADRITGLYEGDGLAAALADARTRTAAIYAHLGLAAPPIDARDPPPADLEPASDVFFAGGEFDQGTWKADFAFDNEREAHRVRVAPFAIASRPVTQGEFAAFIEETGAAQPAHW